jgi:hypothetical protein
MTNQIKLIEELQREEPQEEEENIITYQEAICNTIFKTNYFSVKIQLQDLLNILSGEKNIIIKHKFNCDCYKIENSSYYNDYKDYHIEGENMTIKYVIEELIKQDFNNYLDIMVICSHSNLKGFKKIEGTINEFETILTR